MAYIVLKFYASTPTTVSAEGRPYAALVRCYIYPDITFSWTAWAISMKKGVALTGRNTTSPPCSVGRPTAHAPGRQPALPPTAL